MAKEFIKNINSSSEEIMLMHYHTPKTFIETDLYEIK